ncbi:hypothetical protein GE253_25480, partial [Niveispirillum sp. SYP-B3756]|uniref:hypothetical protein n=1 Tax=Niveispirillum sp. SYP-B3756 TaxID=2662178 RepID=UPI0012919BAC
MPENSLRRKCREVIAVYIAALSDPIAPLFIWEASRMQDNDFDAFVMGDGEINDAEDEALENIDAVRERVAARPDIAGAISDEIARCITAMGEISGFPIGDATKAKARMAASRAGLAYLQALLTVEGAEEEMRRLLEGAQAAIDREAAQARLWYQ